MSKPIPPVSRGRPAGARNNALTAGEKKQIEANLRDKSLDGDIIALLGLTVLDLVSELRSLKITG